MRAGERVSFRRLERLSAIASQILGAALAFLDETILCCAAKLFSAAIDSFRRAFVFLTFLHKARLCRTDKRLAGLVDSFGFASILGDCFTDGEEADQNNESDAVHFGLRFKAPLLGILADRRLHCICVMKGAARAR